MAIRFLRLCQDFSAKCQKCAVTISFISKLMLKSFKLSKLLTCLHNLPIPLSLLFIDGAESFVCTRIIKLITAKDFAGQDDKNNNGSAFFRPRKNAKKFSSVFFFNHLSIQAGSFVLARFQMEREGCGNLVTTRAKKSHNIRISNKFTFPPFYPNVSPV